MRCGASGKLLVALWRKHSLRPGVTSACAVALATWGLLSLQRNRFISLISSIKNNLRAPGKTRPQTCIFPGRVRGASPCPKTHPRTGRNRAISGAKKAISGETRDKRGKAGDNTRPLEAEKAREKCSEKRTAWAHPSPLPPNRQAPTAGS